MSYSDFRKNWAKKDHDSRDEIAIKQVIVILNLFSFFSFFLISFDIYVCTKYTERSGKVKEKIGEWDINSHPSAYG